MKKLALLFLLFALPAAARPLKLVPTQPILPPCQVTMEAGTPCLYVPYNPPPPTCPPQPWPQECAPGLAPGTRCIWPSTAYSLPLAATGQPDLPVIGRMVAIIEGPLLVPMDPRAIRITQSIALSESWWICASNESAGNFAVALVSDAWCPPMP